jgi:hypothetical protein
MEAMSKLNIFNPLQLGKWIYIDDKQETWLANLRKMKIKVMLNKTKTQGDWKIVNRQHFFNNGFNQNFITIDKKNKSLIKEFQLSFIKEGSDKRFEGGTYEKMYDNINSAEGAAYPWRFIQYWNKN